MAQEIEVKFVLKDRNALVGKLHEIGAQRLYPETFEDNIVLDRRGELRTKGALLRVRKFGRYAIATYKGAVAFEGNVKTREEVQTGVESFELAIQLFDSLGFKPVFRYQKYREEYGDATCVVAIDETPVGVFVELEGQEARIAELATALGFAPSQYLTASYARLHAERAEALGLGPHMTFPA